MPDGFKDFHALRAFRERREDFGVLCELDGIQMEQVPDAFAAN
jgi:hypothetical protein